MREGAARLDVDDDDPDPRDPEIDEAGFHTAVTDADDTELRMPMQTALEETRRNALLVYLNNLYN